MRAHVDPKRQVTRDYKDRKGLQNTTSKKIKERGYKILQVNKSKKFGSVIC